MWVWIGLLVVLAIVVAYGARRRSKAARLLETCGPHAPAGLPDVLVDLGKCSGFIASHQGVTFIVTAGHCAGAAVTGAKYRGERYCLKGEYKVWVDDTKQDVGFVSLGRSDEGRALAKIADSVAVQDQQPGPPATLVVRGYAYNNVVVEATFQSSPNTCGDLKKCSCCSGSSNATGWDQYYSYQCLTQVNGACLEGGNSGSVALYKDGDWRLYGVIPARRCSNAAVVPLSWERHKTLIECAIKGDESCATKISTTCPSILLIWFEELLERIKRYLSGY